MLLRTGVQKHMPMETADYCTTLNTWRDRYGIRMLCTTIRVLAPTTTTRAHANKNPCVLVLIGPRECGEIGNIIVINPAIACHTDTFAEHVLHPCTRGISSK